MTDKNKIPDGFEYAAPYSPSKEAKAQLFFYDVVEFICGMLPYGHKIEKFIYGQRELKFEFNDTAENLNQITRLFFPKKFSQNQWTSLIKSAIGSQESYTMKEIGKAHLDLLLDWDNYRESSQGMDEFMEKYGISLTSKTSVLSISAPK